MKALITAALALFCACALATGTPPQSKSSSTSTANSYGSSGDAWAVALPGHGSPSYAGAYSICVQGKGILWNFAWSWSFDAECVRLIAELERMKATPAPKPTMYPMADNVTSGFSPSGEAPKADMVADCGRAPAAPAKGANKRSKAQTVASTECGR